MNNDKIPGYVETIDSHLYCVVVAKSHDYENELIDCHFWDDENDGFKENYVGMYFDEKSYLLMESYLFNFINAECDLMINMYEEEFADSEKLPQIVEITNRMINNCDDEEFIVLAKEFLEIVDYAMKNNTFVGFCF